MSSLPPPDSLLPWACSVLGLGAESTLDVVAGDASNRRYFRLHGADRRVIAVHAPPATEKNVEFLAVRERLELGGVAVPELLAADLDQGFLLLEDFGDRLLLPALSPDKVDEWYGRAFGVLLQLAGAVELPRNWPAYDTTLLSEELSRFPEWFVGKLLGQDMGAGAAPWAALCDGLLASALAQPRCFVHRDFHSRNLMILADGGLGVIDFQDAVAGPLTYDLVSLLRDCYIRWPAAQVEGWALDYRQRLRAAGLLGDVGAAQFMRWFDLMGLQRHLKVLGTFARLYLRDGKPGYLDDLPLVLYYVESVLEKYRGEWPAAAQFADWLQAGLSPVIRQQAWSRAL